MQSIKRASTNSFLMSPSPEVFEVREPLASTNPVCPLGLRW